MKIEVINNERIKVTNDEGEEREIDLEELFGDPQKAELARLAKKIEEIEKDKKEVVIIREIHRDYPRPYYYPTYPTYPDTIPIPTRPYWWYGATSDKGQLSGTVSSNRTIEGTATISGLLAKDSQVVV